MSRRRTEAPRSRPVVAVPAVLVALALVALAVVAVRDLLVTQGWVAGEAWLTAALGSLDGLSASPTLTTVGVALAVLGLVLVLTALRPAGRTHTASTVVDDLWFEPEAVAALAVSAADRAPGVVATRATRTGRRGVVVGVSVRPDHPEALGVSRSLVADEVQPAVDVPVKVRSEEVSA